MNLRLPALALVFGGLGLHAAACGSEYSEKCSLACQLPEGPCASEDAAQCQSDCEAATEGLEVACAQCITERSGWSWRECVDGCLEYHSASGESGGDCEPCTASDEACTDFDIEESSSSACEDVCVPGAGDDGSDETGSG